MAKSTITTTQLLAVAATTIDDPCDASRDALVVLRHGQWYEVKVGDVIAALDENAACLDAEELACLRLLNADGNIDDRTLTGRQNDVMCDLAHEGLADCKGEETPSGYRREWWSITPAGLRRLEEVAARGN